MNGFFFAGAWDDLVHRTRGRMPRFQPVTKFSSKGSRDEFLFAFFIRRQYLSCKRQWYVATPAAHVGSRNVVHAKRRSSRSRGYTCLNRATYRPNWEDILTALGS
jgi:hypothetical protein